MKKMFAVIGDPIAHSMSPAMHNDLFGMYGIDASYLPLRVSSSDLEVAVKGLKAIGISGFNVTIPHKTTIMTHLDRLDPLAEAIGAVNTVKNEDGQLIGYNTDGPGFVRGLKSKIADLESRSALIIGAGGAARAIYFSMAEAGVQKIDIYNRTPQKAEALVEACPYKVDSKVVSSEEARRRMGSYRLIVQTTSIGMLPDTDKVPLQITDIPSDALVSDIIYNPPLTKFLENAAENGATVQNGIDMFIYQGALAFEKWTGIFPDTERMKQNVLQHLGGSTC
ncbi:shikimate dehydrogenase [Bacillus sp. REN3]|uniref:shikimate dehydrogenase n=1 Tax=Bacillus sp. REN3 TaxID=2802440 RepID=UPI001AEDACC8|nr:shikimate dehydrogenase [Bacillus sp. REN3]